MHTIHADAGLSFSAHPARTAFLVTSRVLVPFTETSTDSFKFNPDLPVADKRIYIALLDSEGVFL